MNFTEIQAGNYSSLLGTWTGVACAENRHDGTGEQWKAVSVYSLSVSSDKIKYGNGKLVIQGNILKDSAGSHTLSFENNRGSLDVSLTDADATINWAVYFYPKGVTNDIQPNNGVKIDNTKNLIIIWTSNNDFTEVFAQTDAKPCSKTSVLPSKDNNKKVADTPKSTSAEKVKKLDSSFGEWSISSFLGRTNVSTYEENENEIIGEKISLYSNEASIGDETIDDPVFTTKEYSYDDALEDRFNPTFYDLKPGSFCLTVDVTSKTNKNFGLSYSILNDSDEIVIFTNSRFYKAQRATTSPAITEQVSP